MKTTEEVAREAAESLTDILIALFDGLTEANKYDNCIDREDTRNNAREAAVQALLER